MSLKIFNRNYGMKLEYIIDAILIADGTEQILIEDTKLSNLSGFIDLSKMEVGDTVTIKQHVDINGSYKLYADETYNDTQIPSLLHLTPKGANNRMKITLQQTAGTYRQFAYEFIREV